MVPRPTPALVTPLFKTKTKYPLSKELASIFNYNPANNVRRETASDTIDIVSPGLCDDVLGYIGSSLEEYKGCDIIDIHPGACLWSQKLNDFLKPRRHLLMEPEERYYKPFIEPLLQLPNSSYRHTYLSGAHPKQYFESYEQIFDDDELLFKRKPLVPSDPRLRKLNKSLLVTGSVSRRYRESRQSPNRVHNANLILNHMVHASQTNSMFHGYGLVRMLFWHPEDTKSIVLPDMVSARGGYSAALEIAADMAEVVGQERKYEYEAGEKRLLSRHRDSMLEHHSADRVLKRMDKAGVQIPVHRRSPLHQAAIDRRDKSASEQAGADTPISIIRDLPDHVSLPEAVDAHEESLRSYAQMVDKTKRRTDLGVPFRYVFSTTAQRIFSESDQSRLGPCMDLWGDQIGLEAALAVRKRKDGNDDVLAALEQRLLGLAGELQKLFTNTKLVSKKLQAFALAITNEERAFQGQVMAYDRRPFEAMVLEAEEFWPQFGMYLLDIVPREDNLADEVISPLEANTTMRDLVKSLWQLNASAVSAALDRIGANAAHDLMPEVPELRDASKGGRLRVEELTVRMLTRDMIKGLVKAYVDWPFRPTSLDGQE